MSNTSLLSIVTPVYNEEDSLAALYDRISKVCGAADYNWELIIVDDGSRDDSPNIMRHLHERDPRVKVLFLSRNFGHEIATTAGIDAAIGDAVVLMDADLQDPPEIIPKFVAKWREGYDLVCAQRTEREGETVFKRLTAFLFYRLMSHLVGWSLPRDAGDFRLMDRRVVNAFRACREENRFVRALITWTGFRQTTIPFERAARRSGTTKYNTFQLFGLAITSIASFSVAPLRIATWIGLSVVILSLFSIAVIVYQKIFGGLGNMQGYGFLMASVWFLGGVQCLLIGILGEYLGRTYTETRGRPLYFVKASLGIEAVDDHKTVSKPHKAAVASKTTPSPKTKPKTRS